MIISTNLKKKHVTDAVAKSNVISILVDGRTDVTVTEQGIVYILYISSH